MKFKCETQKIKKALLDVSKGIAIKTTNPILQGIKIEAEDNKVTFYSNNAEMTIEEYIEADVELRGSLVIDGKKISELIKKINSESIIFVDDGKMLSIMYDDNQFQLRRENSDEFPIVKENDNVKKTIIKGQDFYHLINSVIFNASQDDSRPIFKSCLLKTEENKLCSVALDGARMGIFKTNIDNNSDIDVLVPVTSLNNLLKVIDKDKDITISNSENLFILEYDNIKITSRIMGTSEQYVNYKGIISPISRLNIKVKRDELLESLDRLNVLNDGMADNRVNFNIENHNFEIDIRSEDGIGKETILIPNTNTEFKISFNIKFLTECIKSLKDEYIDIGFNESHLPCFIKSETEELLYLISPLRTI